MKIKSEITTEQRVIMAALIFTAVFIPALCGIWDGLVSLSKGLDPDSPGLPIITGIGTLMLMFVAFIAFTVFPATLIANLYYGISKAVGEGIHRRKTPAKG